ncbi:5'-methylthioadenosine/S-adenosylhomocysteine nucleosidase [Gregarina niphandrodes]|uniref:adenosylhomocysteine nucleosidase n=1 Tax=Gregarina niphandrodes TaxID=110365 RepID=A0A023AZX5_GRENI|nr:5'-methylthioadenosine/S-adenosylhomocysteine nucleosidase [Gregarina niphandrodes]EZG44162.1 5'-methylthioadenosine/S-adenosylhomocysteine nucleosidase [Gregarina niphandrodes]|eukprot:XP_011132786.1 5'-methylthioadenosine/S-adenosylhomocysteine nucleosidase [Gregarina niphandrodes]
MSGRTAIVVACESELSPLKAGMTNVTSRTLGGKEFFCGQLEGCDVVLVQCGVGRTNAAATTAVACAEFKPQRVINSGSAGGLATGLKIGDVVVSDRLVYGDVDNRCFGLKYGQVPDDLEEFHPSQDLLAAFHSICEKQLEEHGIRVHQGLIVTVESFCESEVVKKNFFNYWPEAKAVEMEGCAVAHVCQQFKVPAIVVRSISDTAEDHIDYHTFAKLAGERSAQVTRAFLKTLI